MRFPLQRPRLQCEFNGLFGGILCLTHADSCLDESGRMVVLRAGVIATAFEPDTDNSGKRDDLFTTGVVEASPPHIGCLESKWSLRIEENGVRNESDLRGMPSLLPDSNPAPVKPRPGRRSRSG